MEECKLLTHPSIVWSAILKEKESGQKYAVDRWPFDQGENAAVVKVQDWYIKDGE